MPHDDFGKAGEAFCSALLNIYNKEKDLEITYDDLRDKMNSLLEVLRGTTLSALDIVSAEIITSASNLSTRIVGTFMEGVSGMMAAVMERVLRQIFILLTAGPEEILALIGLPLNKARGGTAAERSHLLKAQDNLNSALNIMSKWLSGYGGENYYEKMKSTLVFVNEALLRIDEMLKDLEVPEDGLSSPYFNNQTYRLIIDNIDAAVKASQPNSVLDERFGISDTYEDAKREYIASENKKLSKEYAVRRKVITDEFNEEKDKISASMEQELGKEIKDATGVVGVAQSGDKIIRAINKTPFKIKIAHLESKWEYNIGLLDTEFDLKKQKVVADSSSVISTKQFTDSISLGAAKVAAEFSRDLQNLGIHLKDMATNIADAFIEYQRSQSYTNATYHAIERLKSLFGFFIQLAAKVGGGSADVAIGGLEEAQALLEDVKSVFDEDVEKYVQNSIKTSELAIDLAVGNIEVRTASAVLAGIIAENLIRLINLDEVLEDDSREFNTFKERIAAIVDWDNRPNIWGVDIENSAISPYINLGAEIAKLVSIAPISMSSSSSDDKEDLVSRTRSVRLEFVKLLEHNALVEGVLGSYTARKSQKINLIKRYLDAATFGYFSAGFSALSAIQIAESITKGILTFADKTIDCISEGLPSDATEDEMNDITAAALAQKSIGDTALNTLGMITSIENVKSDREERNKANLDLRLSNYAESGIREPNGFNDESTPGNIRTIEELYGGDDNA